MENSQYYLTHCVMYVHNLNFEFVCTYVLIFKSKSLYIRSISNILSLIIICTYLRNHIGCVSSFYVRSLRISSILTRKNDKSRNARNNGCTPTEISQLLAGRFCRKTYCQKREVILCCDRMENVKNHQVSERNKNI